MNNSQRICGGSKARKQVKCNLKQIDIFTAIQNWKSIKKEKDLKINALSNEIIVIEDSDHSDSELTRTIIANIIPTMKRPLAQPFSDDEDEQGKTSTINSGSSPTLKKENTSGEIETNILPKLKRPLPYSFFDDDLEDRDNQTGLSNETSPSKPLDSSVQPIACSTPLPSNIGVSDGIHTHINNNNWNISEIGNDATIDHSPIPSTNTERTIIQQNLSPKGKVKILENITFSANNSSFCRNTTVIAHCSSCTETNESPVKKMCVEQEKDTKRLNTNDTNSSGSTSNSDSITNTMPNNLRENVATRTDSSLELRRDSTSISTCKSEPKWLSKKNRPDCNKNKRKSESVKQEVSKKCAKADYNGEKIVEKKQDNKKELSQIDNTLKVSSKENMHNYSKDKSITTDRNENLSLSINKGKTIVTDRELGANMFSNQKHISKENSSETVARCDKPANSSNSSKKSLVTGRSPPGKGVVAKKEVKKMNTELIQLITDLFKTVLSCKHGNNLLETQRKLISTFISMDVKWQYTCLKLITRQRKWYNAFKFSKLIHADMEDTDVCDMVNTFEKKNIVDTNYMGENVMLLLQRLDRKDLRGICDKFRLKKTIKTKEEMVKCLLKYSNTQSSLTIHKSTKDLLMEEVQRRMGRCMRVSEAFRNAFDSMYMLGTFTNPKFKKVEDYFKLYPKVIFPTFPIDEYTIFSSRSDFIGFTMAQKYRDELEKCTDHVLGWQVCKTIFTKLRALENDRTAIERFQDAPHLIRYTEKAVYVSTLSFMIEKLFTKYPDDVKVWLEYMIKKVDCPHKIGRWYFYLIWLHMRYLKPLDCDRAAELLIEVLHRKRQHLSEVQLYQLRRRGEQLISTIKYKIQQMNHDNIAQLLPKRIKVENFPKITIDAKTIRSNSLGNRPNYEVKDSNGNKTLFKVEDYALKYYLEELHYTGGTHCEGAIIKATFTLFFFDIIYSAKNSIPGTFVSKIQSVPLDMSSRYFYPNREEEIDKRLTEIESEWSDAKVMEFVKDNYEKHSHEYTVCEVGVTIKDIDFLQIIVECIGRQVLAKIYKRLVKNFREYSSGLPDLLVWNVDRKVCKFVEVKGDNDKLSIGQTLWLNYLNKIGANAEVCHVHSIGCKKKMRKVEQASSLS